MKTYKPTNDKNIIIEIESREQMIDLRKIKKEVVVLNRRITSLPRPVVYPENATAEAKMAIDFYNASLPDLSEIKRKRDEMQAVLDQFKTNVIQKLKRGRIK